MYRSPAAQTPTPPTVVEYVSKLVRYRVYFFATLIAVFGGAMLLMLHAVKLRCDRASNVCELHEYGIAIREREIVVPADAIEQLHVEVRTGSKGGKYAVMTLHMRSGETMAVSSPLLGHFSVDESQTAASELASFLQNEDISSFEVWITQGTWTYVMCTAFAIGIFVLAYVMVREQVRQHRPIRVVIDHDRHLLLIGGREIATRDIASVVVEQGRALFWSSGKNEHIPGWRLVVRTKSIGEEIPATKDFRAGGHADHENARKQILKALGDLES